MQRDIFLSLEEWKNQSNRKPLLLMGARQVGKTHTLKEFAKTSYKNFVYLNFETEAHLRTLFTEGLDPQKIIQLISIEKNITITPEETLLIFDEIQECSEALNSLKYFCEGANNYPVCAAGSLLGITLARHKGFPVGKVNFLHLYPLSFKEFLLAVGEAKLKDYLDELQSLEPLPLIFHEKLLGLFKTYLFIGGMPEAVAEYADSKNLLNIRRIQKEILNAYQLDFAKHAPKEQLMRIHQVWENIPVQLAKENKKFIYSLIRQGARAKEFEVALQWLKEAGLIHKASHLSSPKLPLSAYVEFNFFKLYLLDVGLLGAMADVAPATVIHGNELFQEFRGALTENFVAQSLSAMNQSLYYWTSEGRAELDFILQHEQQILPLEIKSGESTKKKSLLSYAEKYGPNILIRISPMNLKRDGRILNIPLYLVDDLAKWLNLSEAS